MDKQVLVDMRVCVKCGKEKDIDMFYFYNNYYRHTCKECKADKFKSTYKYKKVDLIINLDGEVWKDIVGYEGFYQVSSLGRVKSLKRKRTIQGGYLADINEKVLKTTISNAGYVLVGLHKNKYKSISIHRLVAEAFIPNTENKRTVNHIDCNKKNNSINNLEWATYSENHIHARKNGLMPITDIHRASAAKVGRENAAKRVIDTATNKEYFCLADACRELNLEYKKTNQQVSERRKNTTLRWMSDVINGTTERVSKYRVGAKHQSAKKVIQMDLYGNDIKIWDSVTIAAQSLNISKGAICIAARESFRTSLGFKWRYAIPTKSVLVHREVEVKPDLNNKNIN